MKLLEVLMRKRKFKANFPYIVYYEDTTNKKYPYIVDTIYYTEKANKNSLLANLKENKKRFPNKKLYIHPAPKSYMESHILGLFSEMNKSNGNKGLSWEDFEKRLPFTLSKDIGKNCWEGPLSDKDALSL